MVVFFRGCALSLLLFSAACAPQPASTPTNIFLGSTAPPATPVVTSSTAPPIIVAAHFSSSLVRRGQTWSGEITTSTNAASVEVRTNLFSINVPRVAYGRFRFAARVYDLPSIFIRAYRVRIIARNARGDQAEEDFPLRIR